MTGALVIEPLAAHRDVLPVLAQWFEREWPAYYGAGGRGNARDDLESFASEDRLPVGVVAFRDGALCGVAALKATSVASHAHLSPWAAAGLVEPSRRGRGVGTALLAALENVARRFGFPFVYCGTSSAESLLKRRDWELLERVRHEGQDLGIYRKALWAGACPPR